MSINQQDVSAQQEAYAAEMRRQQQVWQHQQYQINRNNNISQLSNALAQINPFDVIRDIGKYGISTLPLDYQEKTYIINLLCQIFNDPDSDFTSDDWANLVRILTTATSATYNLQLLQMRQGYNVPNMGMGMSFGQQGWGPNGFYNPQYGPGMGFTPGFDQRPINDKLSDDEKEKALINQYKQMFLSRIYQVDPIIFINLLLQDNYEVIKQADQQFERTLRMAIANSLWRLQDNVLRMIYYIISAIFNSEYQKNIGNKGNPSFNTAQGVGFNPQFGMPPNIGPGWGADPYGNPFGMPNGMMGGVPFGSGMPPNGMMGGMPPNVGVPGWGADSFLGGSPFGGMSNGMMGGGVPFGGGMPNGGMMGGPGFMPPPNGMNFNPGFNSGVGMNSGGNAAASPMW